MPRVIRAVELDDVGINIEVSGDFFAGAHSRHGPFRVAGPCIAPPHSDADGGTVLAPGRLDAVEFGGVAFEVALCGHSAHAAGAVAKRGVRGRGRGGRGREYPLDLVGGAVAVVAGILLGGEDLTVDVVVPVGHAGWLCRGVVVGAVLLLCFIDL